MRSTTKDLRYLKSKEKFLEYAFLALGDNFLSSDDFVEYFDSIQGDDSKSLFLRTASFYLFLVKRGDWLVDVPDSGQRVEYLTNTYKYISIFSLIESLLNKDYIDFYQYLTRRKSSVEFPILDKKVLDELYKAYKAEFGAITQCVSFFRALSSERQKNLVEKLKVCGVSPSIENFAKFLYELRSKFVHDAELVHHMSEGTSMSFKRQGGVVCKLSIRDAMTFFEEGLIAYFKKHNQSLNPTA